MTQKIIKEQCFLAIEKSEELVRYFVETYAQMSQSSEEALFAPFRALRAVLGIPDSQHLGCDGPRQTIGVNRYNEALENVREAIAKELRI